MEAKQLTNPSSLPSNTLTLTHHPESQQLRIYFQSNLSNVIVMFGINNENEPKTGNREKGCVCVISITDSQQPQM